jgi:hypothetical protein
LHYSARDRNPKVTMMAKPKAPAVQRIPVPPMPFREFKDKDDFAAYVEGMRKSQDAATAAIQPWQAALKEGDKCTRLYEYADGTRITIFFEIKRSPYEEDRYREDEIWHRSVPGWGYSLYCADGEPGNMHRASFDRQITDDEFAEAVQKCKDANAVFAKFADQK